MKIIFLDIDGVLNLISQGRDDFGSIFHQHLVDNLTTLVESTGAKIVMSSSWRFNSKKLMKMSTEEMSSYVHKPITRTQLIKDGIDYCQGMWKHRNYPGEVIDITPHIDICKRGEEIQMWLDNHENISQYIIIDDDIDMLDSQLDNFVQTSENWDHEDNVEGYGLTKICAEKAIEILNKNG